MLAPTRTLLTLLLLMSTLKPYFLSTVQSSALPDIVHKILQPSLEVSNSINATNPTNRTLTNGLLGDYTSPTPSPITQHADLLQLCDHTLDTNLTALAALTKCRAYQLPLITVLNATGGDNQQLECVLAFSRYYCSTFAARTYCTAAEYAAMRKWMQQESAFNVAHECKPYAKWLPFLDAPPMVTPEITQCDDALVKNGAEETCEKWVADSMTKLQIKDPIEALCKTVFEGERCLIKQACKYCDTADKYLNFSASIWTPTKVACTQWAKDDEPKMVCSSNTLLIVGVILLFVVVILLVILLVACWMCHPSANKPAGGRSSSKGRAGSGSKRGSKRNTRKGKSSIGAKKSSRASSRAKPTSRASMRAKPRSRAPSRVKHSKASRL